MNKLSRIAAGLGALSFFVIAATGIDLIGSRTGVGLLTLGVALLLVSISNFGRSFQNSRPWLVILVLVGAGYFVARALLGGPPGLAIQDLVLVLLGVGVYLAVSASSERMRQFWLLLLALLAVANVGLAVSQWAMEDPFFFWQPNVVGGGDTIGLFGHYNAFASFLNGSVFFFLSYAFLGRNTAARLACLLLSAGLVTSLVISQSRGGWVSFVVGATVWMILLVFFLKQRRSKMVGIVTLMTVGLGVGGIVSSVWAVQKITERRHGIPEVEEITGEKSQVTVEDGGRISFQQMAFEIFLDSPVIGEGSRSFSYRALEKWDPETLTLWAGYPEYAHNEYLQALCDYGLVGFVLLLVVFFLHGVLGVVGILNEEDRKSSLSLWQLGALAGLVAMLCQSYFSFLFHFPACVALAAFQLGILGSRSRVKSGSKKRFTLSGFCVGGAGLATALGLVFLGWNFAQAFALSEKSQKQFSEVRSAEDILAGLESLEKSAKRSWDPASFEIMARRAMIEANAAADRKEPELAREFNERAKDAFVGALEIHPHYPAAIAGLPRVEDALGNHEAAEAGHQRAMKALWSRELRLRTHYHAARGSFLRAFQADDDLLTLTHLLEANERLQKRDEIFSHIGRTGGFREFRKEVQSWIHYFEGRIILQKGSDIWLKAKPRNPELALAYFLEARKRYGLAQDVVAEKAPDWSEEIKRLKFSVDTLEGGQVTPAELTSEQLVELLGR